jgi:hypothetical protein
VGVAVVLSARRHDAASDICFSDVMGLITPLEIIDLIIGRIMISMMHNRELIGVRDEMTGDQPMYESVSRTALYLEFNYLSPSLIERGWFELTGTTD